MFDIYKGIQSFRGGYFREQASLYASLSAGQSPQVLFITCSDSRILPGRIASAGPGDIFVLRNVANMVPEWEQAERELSVSAVIEYAVKILEVKQVIVCGHSGCGGCKLLREGAMEELPLTSAWVEISGDVLARTGSANINPQDFEKENVLCQVQRLQNYPFIAERKSAGSIEILGWYYDIPSGALSEYSEASKSFAPLN